ncbi:hypothetical protein Tco_0592443 [Tanacetum coccineum]
MRLYLGVLHRSLATLVPLSTPVSRLIAPALADLPPRKRFIDSYSSEVSGEEHMEIGTADAETVANLGISDGVRAPTEDGLGMGVEVATSGIREDEEELKVEASMGGTMEIAVDKLVTSSIFKPTRGDVPDLEGTLYDISHYMSKVPLDRITEFETAQKYLRRHMALSQEEFLQIRKDHDDTRRRLRRTMTNTRSRMTSAIIEEMINRRMTKALETLKANRNIVLGNGNDEGGNGNGNGNGNRGGNGNGNHNENDRDARLVVRECTSKELKDALTWWNLHKRTIGTDAAFAMSWRELMKLKAENNNLAAYTQRFQELTMVCTKMVPEDEDQVEKFIGGLLNNIYGNVIAAEPTRCHTPPRQNHKA